MGFISSGSVVRSSGPAGKLGLWEGLKNFKTLHLHKLDRTLENTRATIEKATLRKVKWDPSGDGTRRGVLKHTPTPPLKLSHARAVAAQTLS